MPLCPALLTVSAFTLLSVAKERGWFTTYEARRSKVYSQAREETFEMLGIGTVELRVRSDVDDPTKTDVFKLEGVLHVPDVPVNIISHKKLEKAAGWHHVPPADKRTRTLGGLCDCHGEQLAYFRYFDYSNHTAIFQDRHLIPGTKEAPDEVVVPSCAPQGCALGESTSQNTVLNLPGPLQVRWVTWREEDQKTATSH